MSNKKNFKKNKKEIYIISTVIAFIFTIGFILTMIKNTKNISDIVILIGFSLFIFAFSFIGFGCGIKIVFDK